MNIYSSLLNPGFDRIGDLETIPSGMIGNSRNSEFSYSNMLYNIAVVGLGGTGGYVIRDLCRFLYSIQLREPEFNFRLALVDGDTVEQKNLLRQNFLPKDIGKSKSSVLADRHSRAFGFGIDSYTKRIDNRSDLQNVLNEVRSHPAYSNNRYDQTIVNIIVGCVDNNQARRTIHSYMNGGIPHREAAFWIDSGNEKKGGQVVCGGRFMGSDSANYRLPTVTDIYPEILEEAQDSQSQVSCAERLLQDEQNIFVNIDAATHVLNFVRMIVGSEDIQIHGVEFNINGKVAARHLGREGLAA